MNYQNCYPGIKKAMDEKGENAKQLTALLQIPRSSVGNRLNKITDFKISEIEKMLVYYGKTYEELFR